jgi:hypothetical protein
MQKTLGRIAAIATGVHLALACWVFTGSTVNAWSLSSLFGGRTYSTPTRVVGHTMYYYNPATARWVGAYTDARRPAHFGTGYRTYAQSTFSLQRTLSYNQSGRDLNGNLVYGQNPANRR